jgi:hypothetical protein
MEAPPLGVTGGLENPVRIDAHLHYAPAIPAQSRHALAKFRQKKRASEDARFLQLDLA